MRIVVSGSLAEIITPLARAASGNALRALKEGLGEGGDKVRTKVRKALRAQTNVKKAESVNSRTSSVRAGLEYIIKGTGKGIPIEEFPVSAPGHVTASPWGVARVFKRSFVRPDTGAYSARLSSKRFPVRKLFGPSIAKEIVKDQSLAAFEAGVRSDVIPIIEKRLARILG